MQFGRETSTAGFAGGVQLRLDLDAADTEEERFVCRFVATSFDFAANQASAV